MSSFPYKPEHVRWPTRFWSHLVGYFFRKNKFNKINLDKKKQANKLILTVFSQNQDSHGLDFWLGTVKN